MPSAEIRHNRLYVFGTPFATKDLLKSIAGAAWDRELRAWNYPVSTQIIGGIASIFPGLGMSEDVERLMAKKAKEDTAQLIKAAKPDSLGNFYSATPPWGHQRIAYHYAHALVEDGGGVMLALDMGTGKSKVAVDLINNLFTNFDIDGERYQKNSLTLIVAPLSVVPVWPEQFTIHSHTYHQVIQLGRGLSVDRKTEIMENEMDFQGSPLAFVVNYESVWRKPLAQVVMGIEWDCIICDEIHKIKSPGGKASMFMGRLAERSSVRLGLTGTPMPHSPLDLYAQYRFLNKGVFGTSFTRFKRKYAIMGGFENRQVVAFKNLSELTGKFDETSFRVESEDVLDLPEAHHITITVELDEAERDAYQRMQEDFIALVKGSVVTAANALVKLLRLQQIVQGWVKDVNDNMLPVGVSKQESLFELLGGIGQNEPVVVFCLFKTDLSMVADVAHDTGRKCYELSGSKDETEKWKQAEAGPVIAVQFQSGGVGIDLTKARYVVYLSGTFNYGNYEQSLARVHRPGQDRPVTYYHLIAEHTIDVKVYKALQKKEKVIDSVLNELTRGDF